MKFKIGDHVVVEESNVPSWDYGGKTGVIHRIDKCYGYPYRITMDDGSAPSWCTVRGLVEDKKVFTKKDLKNGDVIKKRNGNVEIVVLPLGTLVTKTNGYNTLRETNDDLTDIDGDDAYDIVAVRRPHADNECSFGAFQYNYGELVYDRERDTKPLYNGKVVCIDVGNNPDSYTLGKIYQFKDGVLTNDYGREMRKISPVTSFEEWNNWSSAKWLEIKE